MTALILTLVVLAAGDGKVEVTVADVNDHGAVKTYRGVPLLDALPKSGSGDQILLRCGDGFISLLPKAVVARWKPLLASEERTANGWSPLPKDRQPLYLVWPNREHPELDQDHTINPEGWAWAVVEVTSASGTALLKPAGASKNPAIEKGREVWIQSCFHCHALHGVGGLVSWDLADPTPVWAYLDWAHVAAYALDPKSQDPSAHMPAQHLSPDELSSLMAFLEAAVPADQLSNHP